MEGLVLKKGDWLKLKYIKEWVRVWMYFAQRDVTEAGDEGIAKATGLEMADVAKYVKWLASRGFLVLVKPHDELNPKYRLGTLPGADIVLNSTPD